MRAGARACRVVWLAVGALAISLTAAASVSATEGLDAGGASAPDAQGSFVPGELIVKLAPNADPRALDGVLAKHRAKRLRRLFSQLEDAQGRLRETASQRAAAVRQRFAARVKRARKAHASPPRLENLYVLELDGSADVRAAAAELAALPEVEYAEPNWILHAQVTPLPSLPLLPDDRFVTQDGVNWSEGAWGQDFLDLWGIANVRAIEGWNVFDEDDSGGFGPGETKPGEGVVVAVIDTGVDHLHPDIAANIWTNPGETAGNGVDDDGNGFVDDVRGWNFFSDTNDAMDPNGHGTHVAGTIAAVADGTYGVVGVAPWARIMPVAGLNANGSGTITDMAAGVVYAADNGADILSNSWGGYPNTIIADAFAYADSVGAIAVAAAGNSNADAGGFSPANLPNVITVAAIQPDEVRASFSNFGFSVEVAAPGTGTLSLNASGGNNTLTARYPERVVETHWIWIQGTSMACPHVSGVLAALMSRFPGETGDELLGRLLAGARNIDAANPNYAGQLGAGAVDLLGSLEAIPVPMVQLVGTTPASLPIGGAAMPLVVHLYNFWAGVTGVVATLSSSDPNVTINDGVASFGNLPTGVTSTNAADPFQIVLAPSVPIGSTVQFEIELEGNGYAESFPLLLKVPYFEETTTGSGLPASDFIGWQVNFNDYGGDSLPDVVFVGLLGTFTFVKNLGSGVFGNATPETGISFAGNGGKPSVFFDADNDGDREVVLGGIAPPPGGSQSMYYEKPPSGPYLDRTIASGVGGKKVAWPLVMDYDGDGWLDLAGGHDQLVLLRNNANGTFSDQTVAAGYQTTPPVLGTVGQSLAVDYDDDGDPDVFGVTGNGGIFLLRNNGNGTFSSALNTSGIDNTRKGGRGLAAGDYDNDGDLDLFFTGLSSTNDPTDRNALYRNNGNGTFTNVTPQSGDLALGNASGWNGGTDFFDFDNDGDLDLLLSAEGRPNEVHYHVLYRNDGGGVFTIVNEPAFPSGFGPGSGTAGIADYDLDGSLDIYAPDGNFGGTGRGGLLRNRIGALNHSIRIDLVGVPREPYGARVRVHTGGGFWQTREVHNAVAQPLPLHFGLGQSTLAERVEIRWPDGRLQRIADVAANQTISFVEQGVFCTGSEDTDADGVLDTCDNCPSVSNAGQADADADGAGDACNDGADADADEWSNALDVCPNAFDPGQADANGDGVGDACLAAVPALPQAGWLSILAGVALAAARALRPTRQRI